MSRFVKPEPVRIPISGGDFIDIQKRLNHGEREDMFTRMSPFVTPGEHQQLNRREVRTAKVFAYLLGWSLTDEVNDKVVPVPYALTLSEQLRLDTIRSLDTQTFDEIHDAITAHEEAMEAERTAQKKIHSGNGASPAISASPADAAGDTSGSGPLIRTSTEFSSIN